MAKKVGSYQIPFQQDKTTGDWSMMEYTSSAPGVVRTGNGYEWLVPDAWRDNKPFKATLVLTGHARGRSAARFNVKNIQNDEEYSFGMGAFYDAVVKLGVKDGKITGEWVFRKQGANYSLQMVET